MPIIQVVSFDGKEYSTDAWQEWYGEKSDESKLVNSGEFDGLGFHAACDAIARALEEKGLGKKE